MKNGYLKKLKISAEKFFRTKGINYGITLGMAGLMLIGNMALAADAKQMFQDIIKIVGSIFLGVGAFMGAMGLGHYAIANGDGDGPAKRKATMELASAVALVLVGVALRGSLASTLANYIETS